MQFTIYLVYYNIPDNDLVYHKIIIIFSKKRVRACLLSKPFGNVRLN